MEKQLTIRTSWKGITIRDYMMYLGALTNPNTSDFEKNLEILALLCGIERSELNDLPANQIIPLFNKMEFMLTEPKDDVQEFYDIAGKKFRLCLNVADISAGQFIDLTNYTKDPEFIMDNLHTICAILLLPVIPYKGKSYPGKIKTEKYKAETLNERAEFLFENMPIGGAIGISNFFTFLYSLFIEITKLYLKEQRTKKLNEASKMLSAKVLKKLQP